MINYLHNLILRLQLYHYQSKQANLRVDIEEAEFTAKAAQMMEISILNKMRDK